jgi:Fe-S cluster assembly iron-binding protein IscA
MEYWVIRALRVGVIEVGCHGFSVSTRLNQGALN